MGSELISSNTNLLQFNNNLNMAISKDSVVLYLFSPRRLPNTTVRTLQYKFRPGFIEAVNDALESSSVMDRSLMSVCKSKVSNDVILPDTTGIKVKTSNLSDNWTFMLVIDGTSVPVNLFQDDHDEEELSYMRDFKPANFRFIYLGICIDEPVNMNTIYLPNPTYNDTAQLIVTRKIVYKNISQNNRALLKPNLHSDILNVYGNEQLYEIDEDLFPVSPCDIGDMIQSEEGDIFSIEALNPLRSSEAKFLSSWELPKTTLKGILSSIKDGVDSVQYEMSNPIRDIYGKDFGFEVLKDDILQTLSASNSAYYHEKSLLGVGIANDQAIRLNTILSLNAEIVIVKNSNDSLLSVVDTSSYIVPETVFSSLLEHAIPSLLLKWNLSSISFIYDSYSNYLNIETAEATENVDQQVLSFYVEGFMSNLNNELFDILKYNCGEFILSVSSSIYGSSLINLRFYDFNKLGEDDFVENVNTISSFSTNNIGNISHVSNNANEILSLINNSALNVMDDSDQEKFVPVVDNNNLTNYTHSSDDNNIV